MDDGTNSRKVVRRLLSHWGYVVLGLLLGGLTGIVGLLYTILSGLVLLLVFLRPRAYRYMWGAITVGARRLVEWEQWRLVTFLHVPSTWDTMRHRLLPYLFLRSFVGILGLTLLSVVLYGFVGLPSGMVGSLRDARDAQHAALVVLYTLGFGIIALYLALAGVVGVVGLDRLLAQRFLTLAGKEVLQRRVAELSTTRAAVVDAVNDERRRIERDLHDGVQQRLVTLGMLIGRARRTEDSAKAERLLEQAHEQSQQALSELREVSWRVYPAALDSEGLNTALETVAERSSLPVRLHSAIGTDDTEQRLPRAVETVVYFVVSEAVTNAAKHSAASAVDVDLSRVPGEVMVTIRDDGIGGAVAEGAGLSGLARRVAALDGLFELHSPDGGPTTITVRLPCE